MRGLRVRVGVIGAKRADGGGAGHKIVVRCQDHFPPPSSSPLLPSPPPHTRTLGHASGAAGVADCRDVLRPRRDVRARVAPPERLDLVQAHDAEVGAGGGLRDAAVGEPPHNLRHSYIE